MTPEGRAITIVGGRVVDPASGFDDVAAVRLESGRVAEIGRRVSSKSGDTVIEAGGTVVAPGFVDPHVHLREPGAEEKETIQTGASAAAAGGFTQVCAMPNTTPVIDTPELVRDVMTAAARSGGARVHPIAAATIGSAGRQPSPVRSLVEAGAVAVSDDGLPIATAELLAQVLGAAASVGVPVAEHCEDTSLSAGGAVRAGEAAERLGAVGIPPRSESEAVERDLEVLARVGGRLHLCHLSTAESVRLLRDAKAAGLGVTAEACPHHVTLTYERLFESGTNAKMNPPLADETDRAAIEAALIDGTIDCVATDHAPHTAAEKSRPIDAAPFGVVGLETAFGVLYTRLVASGKMPLLALIERMTIAPARAFGLAGGRLMVGEPADVVIVDTERSWVVAPDTFRSKSRNTPWGGARLTGKPILTIVRGEIAYDDRA